MRRRWSLDIIMKLSLTRFKRTNVERNLCFVLFFALFPGFFFYHTAIALGIISAIFGGFFSPISVVVIIALLPLTLFGMLRRSEFFSIDLLFWAIIIYWIFILLMYQAFGEHSYATKLMVTESSIRDLLANVACYVVARSLGTDSDLLRYALLMSLLGMLAIAFSNANDGLFYLRENSNNSDLIATYQGFGRSALVVSVFVLTSCKRFFSTLIIIVIAIVLLFLNGARSEFVFFVLAAGVHISFVILRTAKIRAIAIFLLVAIGFVGSSYFSDVIALLPQTRMLQLMDIWNSTSGESRTQLNAEAVKNIEGNPLFGSFGAYADTMGGGSYAHNLLSAWVDLGLIGFALYVIALFVLLIGGKRMLFNKSGYINSSTLMFAVSLLVAYVAAKEYTYMIFGLTCGLLARDMAVGRR